MAALSIVRTTRRLQLLRSAIVDRYACNPSRSSRQNELARKEVLGILESTRVCSSPRASAEAFTGARAHSSSAGVGQAHGQGPGSDMA